MGRLWDLSISAVIFSDQWVLLKPPWPAFPAGQTGLHVWKKQVQQTPVSPSLAAVFCITVLILWATCVLEPGLYHCDCLVSLPLAFSWVWPVGRSSGRWEKGGKGELFSHAPSLQDSVLTLCRSLLLQSSRAPAALFPFLVPSALGRGWLPPPIDSQMPQHHLQFP